MKLANCLAEHLSSFVPFLLTATTEQTEQRGQGKGVSSSGFHGMINRVCRDLDVRDMRFVIEECGQQYVYCKKTGMCDQPVSKMSSLFTVCRLFIHTYMLVDKEIAIPMAPQ